MSEQKKANAPETPEAKATQPETAAVITRAPRREPDRVAMVSRRADGEPDQSEGFEVIGEEQERR